MTTFGTSAPVLDGWLEDRLGALPWATLLDVGAGEGKIGLMAKRARPEGVVHAVEIWEPAATYLESVPAYEKVLRGSAEGLLDGAPVLKTGGYDLAVFGDVLEHLRLSDAVDVLDFVLQRVKHVVVVWPLGYAQDPMGGNCSEVHRCSIELSDLTRFDVREFVTAEDRAYPHVRFNGAVLRGRKMGGYRPRRK